MLLNTWYQLSKELKREFRRWACQVTVKNLDKHVTKYRCDTVEPRKTKRGTVLFSYYNTIGRGQFMAYELLNNHDQPIPHGHQTEWKSLQMARTFLDMGYALDIISWTNDRFIPRKPYDIFIDVRHNMQRLAPLLNNDCVKIQHIDLCHMLYNNYAEARRLIQLQQRRGVTLTPRRFERPNLAIEHADCATINGGKFAIDTFLYAKKPLFPTPQISVSLYPSPEEKDFEVCRNRFLWLGSGGFVRKGLDLVLEAFAGMPYHHLTICGPISKEKDFERAYYRELYETPNIHTLGWIDTTSPQFYDLVNSCSALIYASCAEAQCGSVITCLHSGIIPVISYESDVDVHDFGVLLEDCSIENIQRAISLVSQLPVQELSAMALKAWKYARSFHTQERFAQEYRKTIEIILATHDTSRNVVEQTSTSPPI